jgi:transposase
LGMRLGIQTSPTTILRRIMAVPTPPPPAVSTLGIDDFALLRGCRYGTILVDLSRHQVIDLLPDRQTETAAAWMEQHPEIELVSRDRGGNYASAATAGAPQAVQCADRFHVLSNLGEALQGLLARYLAAHRRGQVEPSRGTPLADAPAKQPPTLSPKAVELSRAKRAERLACYQQVVDLRKLGFSQTAIANQVGIGHATVSRWLAHDLFPEQQPRPRKIELDAHRSYLRERWEAGCHNIAQLYRELVARGYTHSYASVYEQLVRLLPEGKKNAAQGCDLAPPPVTARQAMFLCLRRPEDLEAEEQQTLLMLRHLHPEVGLAYDLVQQFAQMLRTRTGEQLDAWLEHVRASEIRELQGFVAGVERDKAAVLAGLTRPESNAITEGHVCKLKMIKRLMFGRAGFPLLRQRVLHAV